MPARCGVGKPLRGDWEVTLARSSTSACTTAAAAPGGHDRHAVMAVPTAACCPALFPSTGGRG